MTTSIDELSVYLHLARALWRKKKMSDRDRVLILAAVTSELLRMPFISDYCRQLVLENNHGHMLRHWESVADALGDPDFLHFFKQVKRRFPLEKAESLLNEFGVDRANERSTYYSDAEYAAAILDVDLEWLKENYRLDN